MSMKDVKTLNKQIAVYQKIARQLIDDRDSLIGNLKFKCGCGKQHALRECDLIKRDHVSKGLGYEDDSYYTQSVRVGCPDTGVYNVLVWPSTDSMEYDQKWKTRTRLDEAVYWRLGSYFKSKSTDYNGQIRFWNIDWFDKNQEALGLTV